MVIINLNDINKEIIETAKKKIFYSQVANIGSVYKIKRKELDYTLEKTCEKICCPAYVSKFERNQVPKLNSDIMYPLCERVNLDYESLLQSSNYDELLSALHEYLMENVEELKKRYEKLKENNYFSVSNLISCLYFMLIKDYNNLNAYMSKLEQLKSSMCSFELAVYMIIYIDYNIKTYQYTEALKYYNYVVELQCTNDDVKILLAEEKFLIDCGMHSKYNNNRDIIEKDNQNLKTYYDFYYPLNKQIRIRNEYLKIIDTQIAKEIICSNDLQINTNVSSSSFTYAKCLVLAKAGMYKEVLDIIKDYNRVCKCELICLYAYSLFMYLKKNKNKISEEEKNEKTNLLKKLIKESRYENEDTLHLAFLKLMQFELDFSEDIVIFNYIKKELFPLFDKFNIAFYKEYAFERYSALAGKLCKYKDAYDLLCKYFIF